MERHNAHMKIRKDLWDRAFAEAILSGESMTQFVEEALALLLSVRCDDNKEDIDESDG